MRQLKMGNHRGVYGMDQETRETLNIEEPEQEGAEARASEPKRKGSSRRAKLVEVRNRFCRGVRSAFDSVAAFFLKIWAVVGPVCKKIGHGVAVAARAAWKVIGPACRKLWQWIKPGILFLGNKVKAGAAYLTTRFKGLNKAMQIGIGAVSGSLVLLIIALMISAHVSRTAMLAAQATPDNVLPVVSETEAPTAAPTASPIPEPMKGLPITLISASLMALAFMGFMGIA